MFKIFNKLKFLFPICGPRGQRYLLILFSLLLPLYCWWEFKHKGANPVDWDLLPISVVATSIIFLQLIRHIPRKMDKMLDFLFDRKVLEVTGEKLESFKQMIAVRTEVWSRGVGLVVSFTLLTMYLIVYWDKFTASKIGLTAGVTLIAYIAGNFFGQMAYYGQLSRLLTKASIRINVVPGHVDKAGGLERIGGFYFFQAMVVAIPALLLAIWWLIIPVIERYQAWRDAYLGLFILAIILEVLSFIIPLWAFHKKMQKQKGELIRKADRLCPKINVLMDKLITKPVAEEKGVLRENWEDMRNFYESINNMPTWPLDAAKRKYFSWGNAMLLLPVIVSWIQETEIGQRITDFISQIGG